jgi:hypothetical protein
MADLLTPILVIILMYIVITLIEDRLYLLCLAFLFLPIAYIFALIVNSGGYNQLFGATIPTGVISQSLISGIMITVPLFAVLKILTIQKAMKGRREEE